MWPSAQCVINVGIVSAATTSRLVPDAVRIDNPSSEQVRGDEQEASAVREQAGEQAHRGGDR